MLPSIYKYETFNLYLDLSDRLSWKTEMCQERQAHTASEQQDVDQFDLFCSERLSLAEFIRHHQTYSKQTVINSCLRGTLRHTFDFR